MSAVVEETQVDGNVQAATVEQAQEEPKKQKKPKPNNKKLRQGKRRLNNECSFHAVEFWFPISYLNNAIWGQVI